MPDLATIQKRALADITALAAKLKAGDLSVAEWERAMQRALIQANAAAYMAGAGKTRLSTADQRNVKAAVDRELGYLRGFAKDLPALIEAERWAGIAARAKLYAAGSLRSGFYHGQNSDYDLPATPGDGSSECLMNCQCTCYVEPIEGEEGNGNFYWETHAAESCPTCDDRASKWNPLPVRVGVA